MFKLDVVKRRVLCASLVLAGCLGSMGVLGKTDATGVRAAVVAAGSDGAVAALGIRFAEVSPVPTVLPSGQGVLQRGDVERLALLVFHAQAPGGGMRPDVSVMARFGYFPDDQYARILPDGARVPIFQDRPVWDVEYDGVVLVSNAPGATALVNHEEHVVLDAVSGAVLASYTYR